VTPAVGRALGGLASGLLFGAGLVVSGMTDPANVLGFLDVFGRWDPKLAFVMLGAIVVHALALRVLARRPAPWLGAAYSVLPPPRIDGRLVLGSLVFGVGWGLSGYCPGPAIASLPAAGARGLAFVASLAAGQGVVLGLDGLGSWAWRDTSASRG